MKRWLWALALLALSGGKVMAQVSTADAQHVNRVVSVNQVGYLPGAPKYGMLAAAGERAVTWALLDAATQSVVAAGVAEPGRRDAASGDRVLTADFSDVTAPGTYILVLDDVQSVPFRIGADVYRQLKTDALRYFYLSRSGIELEPAFAGRWARPAGHLSDDAVTCFRGVDAQGTRWDGCDYMVNARGGWYDAGDFGKYVVNAGISVWTLQNLYERLPDAFGDGTLNIPESGSGRPDILDETRWEMEWLLSMQVPDGQPQAGMVHHKLHDERWGGIPELPPATVENRSPGAGRSLMPPSTAATLNLAAVTAQCARIWRTLDAAFAARCLQAAERAWQAAHDNPIFKYGNIPGQGGGNYDDAYLDDEFYWAAAELWITTGKASYRDAVRSSPFFTRTPGQEAHDAAAMNWGNVAALGTISLALLPNELAGDEIAALRGQIIAAADGYLAIMGSEGYRVSLHPDRYYWGSNSDVLNNAIILALAYDFTDEARYLNRVAESLDYLLGRNALAFSFISGYGTTTMQHPHHRFWANLPAQGYPPPPPGAVAGGPNGSPSDPTALEAGLSDAAPARRYLDEVGSWSTNEVTINWNAPLVWVTAYLDALQGK